MIQAYKTAAKEALANAQSTNVELYETFIVGLPFSLEGKVNSIIKKYRIAIAKKEFTDVCKLELQIPLSYRAQAEYELKATHGIEIFIDEC